MSKVRLHQLHRDRRRAMFGRRGIPGGPAGIHDLEQNVLRRRRPRPRDCVAADGAGGAPGEQPPGQVGVQLFE